MASPGLSQNLRTVQMKPDFAAFERFISDNQESAAKASAGLDLIVRSMAMLVLAYARQRSAGPVAPRRRSNPALANKIPVQRITGAYYSGWKIQRLGIARWLVYNDSKEAMLIETGMFQRVRRPILKLSIISMLKYMEGTRTEQRFLASMVSPRRNAKGQYAAISISQRLMGTDTLGGMAGPTGKLPG